MGILRDSPLEEGNHPEEYLSVDLFEPSRPLKVDEAGAQTAFRNKVLRTLITEPFYAVHFKAQRKVPIPIEIDIDTAFNSKSFSKLIDYEVDDNVTLQSVRFVQESPFLKYSSAGKLNVEEEDLSQVLKDALEEDSRKIVPSPLSAPGASKQSTDYPDNIFNLSKSVKPDLLLPLSQALAEGIQEHGNNSKKARKKKHAVAIDRREMLPAGALSSEDENESRNQLRDNVGTVSRDSRKNYKISFKYL